MHDMHAYIYIHDIVHVYSFPRASLLANLKVL